VIEVMRSSISGRPEPPDGGKRAGVHLNTELAAEVLVDGAVNIGNESGLRVLPARKNGVSGF
jgi:hypothetical protein